MNNKNREHILGQFSIDSQNIIYVNIVKTSVTTPQTIFCYPYK